jgi:hypothetical protein
MRLIRVLVPALGLLDLGLLMAFVGAQVFDHLSPWTCQPSLNSRVALPCVSPAQVLAALCLIALALLLPVTSILFIFAQVLFAARARRTRDGGAVPPA